MARDTVRILDYLAPDLETIPRAPDHSDGCSLAPSPSNTARSRHFAATPGLSPTGPAGRLRTTWIPSETHHAESCVMPPGPRSDANGGPPIHKSPLLDRQHGHHRHLEASWSRVHVRVPVEREEISDGTVVRVQLHAPTDLERRRDS